MSLHIPKRALGTWCKDIIQQCTASQKLRVQRGAALRNLFLTGDDSGNPQTYPKTNTYIENLSAYNYSPVELRFSIETYGTEQADEAAMATAASSRLHREIRRGGVDVALDDAVLWSLVKGKAFIKLLWTTAGLEPYIVQPELMGVLREDLSTLDEQEAFVHQTFVTLGRFEQIIQGHPDFDSLMRKAASYVQSSDTESPDRANMLKEVILGGLNPFQMPGQTAAPRPQGLVDWLGGPNPLFSPKVLASLIRLDELWVRDADRDGEWTTLQLIADDAVIEGKHLHRNVFADPSDVTDKKLLEKSRTDNPLSGKTPFIEFCSNPLHGYFWGISSLSNVALLQASMNARVNGIQGILRRQENPPRVFIASQSINQAAYAKLNKPAGYLTEPSPNAKIETLAPQMPADIWADVEFLERMYDDMGGFTPTVSGRGEKGVRSGAQAETLVRTSSPRFKNRALRIERSVEEVGALVLDIMKARIPDKLAGWVQAGDFAPSAAPKAWWSIFLGPPSPGAQRVEFYLCDLPEGFKVTVDSHSSSPAFSLEARELAFALFKAGAINAAELIALTHPPHEETLINTAKKREIEEAQFLAAHPEIAEKKAAAARKR